MNVEERRETVYGLYVAGVIYQHQISFVYQVTYKVC